MPIVHSSEYEFEKVSEVDCPVDRVWRWATSPEGINAEMRPLMAMKMPPKYRDKTLADVEPGTHLGKSLLLLFGFLPCGYDDITLTLIEPGRMFREESNMTAMRTWIHQRTLEPVGDKTIVTDHITFAPNAPLSLIPGFGRLMHLILSAFFDHRHRRLIHGLAPVGSPHHNNP